MRTSIAYGIFTFQTHRAHHDSGTSCRYRQFRCDRTVVLGRSPGVPTQVRDTSHGRRHVPTRPNWGLEGSACASFGMRPAKRANRPASTAARMLLAIITGSRAFDTAV